MLELRCGAARLRVGRLPAGFVLEVEASSTGALFVADVPGVAGAARPFLVSFFAVAPVGTSSSPTSTPLVSTGSLASRSSSTSGSHVAEQMVRACTRGNGFDANGEPNDAVAAVVISCAARLHANPTMIRQESAGPFGVSRGTFQGWTLAEQAVLHGYRIRAR